MGACGLKVVLLEVQSDGIAPPGGAKGAIFATSGSADC